VTARRWERLSSPGSGASPPAETGRRAREAAGGGAPPLGGGLSISMTLVRRGLAEGERGGWDRSSMASQFARVRSTFAVRCAKGSKLGRVDAVDLLSCYAKLQPKRVATRFTRERRLREGREAEVVRAGVEKTPKWSKLKSKLSQGAESIRGRRRKCRRLGLRLGAANAENV
jgi:hypothetical protein